MVFSPAAALTKEQAAFLADNFDVYDPKTKGCYTDFSRVLTCRFVILGDWRKSSPLLRNIQNAFLKLFIKGPSSCLLDEGFCQNQKVDKTLLTDWPALPEQMTVLGFNVRNSSDESALKYRELSNRINQLSSEQKEQFRVSIQQNGQWINQLFLSGLVKINKKQLELPASFYKTVENTYHAMLQKFQAHEELIRSCKQQCFQLEIFSEATALSSSYASLEYILNVNQTFQQVVAVWGLVHVVTEDAFFEGLDKAKIKYIVLVPNKRMMKVLEAEAETAWNDEETSTVALPVACKANDTLNGDLAKQESTRIKMPQDFCTVFHPSIQRILEQPKRKKINPVIIDIYTIDKQTKLSNTVRFPPHTPIHFEQISSEDLRFFEGLSEDPSGDLKAIKERLMTIVKMPFLFNGLSVVSMNLSGRPVFSVKYIDMQPVLVMETDQPFEITGSRSEGLMITATRLFTEMQRRDLSELYVCPQQSLIFTDITMEEINDIVEETKPNIQRWLDLKCPQAMHARIGGYIFVTDQMIKQSNGQIHNALVISSKKSFWLYLNQEKDITKPSNNP